MTPREARIATLAGCDRAALERTRNEAAARGDRDTAQDAHDAMQLRARSQTPEIENSGRLFEHIETIGRAPATRTVARYTGDPLAWMLPYMRGGTGFRINRAPDVVRIEPVSLRGGERVQIVRADGSVKTL